MRLERSSSAAYREVMVSVAYRSIYILSLHGLTITLVKFEKAMSEIYSSPKSYHFTLSLLARTLFIRIFLYNFYIF